MAHGVGVKTRVRAMRIDVLPPNEDVAASGAHMLPCEIEYSGEAIVSAYFKPATGKRGLEATFRGRALRGVSLSPPAGYVGAVLQDTNKAEIADGEERRWLHRGTIDAFTVWDHDAEPPEDAPVFKCMRWAAIADVLHADHGEVEEAVKAEE